MSLPNRTPKTQNPLSNKTPKSLKMSLPIWRGHEANKLWWEKLKIRWLVLLTSLKASWCMLMTNCSKSWSHASIFWQKGSRTQFNTLTTTSAFCWKVEISREKSTTSGTHLNHKTFTLKSLWVLTSKLRIHTALKTCLQRKWSSDFWRKSWTRLLLATLQQTWLLKRTKIRLESGNTPRCRTFSRPSPNFEGKGWSPSSKPSIRSTLTKC